MTRPLPDLFDLTDRTALVTGAGSGIGRAYAEGLAEAGAAVACVDVDGPAAEETAADLPTDAVAIPADVTAEADIEAAVEQTVADLGGLDAVFPNAGVGGAIVPLADHDLADWDRVVDVNLTGVFLTARAAARHFVESGTGGSITSTASIYGLTGSFNGASPAYTAAKGGVVNLTRDMAVSLAPHGVRVNAVAPGFVETSLFADVDVSEEEMERFVEEIERRTLLGRLAGAEELRGIAVFLASDAASYVTGQTYPVDGGWLSV
ncbi:SDR family NAD(P)-dependent oxidoreductase [Halomarina ordinaria]|uniref:SDR family NAD(P)-dependent oxidoreductase n=1 Tax=Halomarina ordinaria TaxID=3033939 RepID=A0ABD5UB83_9EURY|nr:SDR family NAD(P)-dependent oxidoreductase [Halomarina sp. PSRA2]